jgi:hypothetical protein
MRSSDQPELNPELETAELRRQMTSTGISGYLEHDLADIELESSESLLARLKSIEESAHTTPEPKHASGRRLDATLLTAEPGLDLDFETAELRRHLSSTGVSGYLEDDLASVELESSQSLLARLKSIEEPAYDIPRPVGEPRRRRLVPTLLAGTAAAVVAGVLVAVQPWGTPVAQASTPPLLDYEFAEAQRIADAPGIDPAEALEQLALAADQARSGTSPSAIQHVITEEWSIDTDFDPDPDSTITATRTETWLRPDGSFRTRAHLGQPLNADGRGVPLGGRLDRGTAFFDEGDEPAGSWDADFFTHMPNTVNDIRSGLLDDNQCADRERGQERTWCLTDQLRNLSQIYVIPPDVMASIWRMLAQEEGIRSLGTVKDRTGRESVALSFIWDGAPEYRMILLGDPQTGQVVGSERILIKPSPSSPVEPPAIQDFFTIVKSENQ